MIKNHTNGMGSAQQCESIAVVPKFCKYNFPLFRPFFSDSFLQHGDRGGLIQRPSMGGKHFGATFETPSTMQSVDDNYNTNTGVSRRDPIIMPIMEKPVSYSNIVSREIVVDNLEIPTTLTEGTFVKLYNVPNDLLANCQQKQPFNNNYLGRGNVKIKVIVSSSQFHQGMLCVFWAPMLSKTVFEGVFTGDKTQISNLQCGYIDLNRPQPFEMVINYSHLENYLRLNAATDTSVDGSLGIFGVHVFDQLQVATGGSTTVNASIIVSFDGWEFYLPVAVDTCTSLSLSRKNKRPNSVKSQIFEQQGNHFSNVHNSWTVIKNVADSTIAQEQHGDEFENKQSADLDVQADISADASNMDKPFVALNPQPITLKNSQYLNNDTNVEHLSKLTLVASEQCPSRIAHYGRNQDECSIRYIAKIPSFIYEIPWTTSNIPGDQLFSLLICPSPINTSIRPVPTGDTVPISQSYLDYLSGQFLFWRARFNLHFKLVASNYQTGILRVGIVYGKYDATATANEANCQFMRIIDLKEGQREYDFTTEFPTTTQMLQCTSTHRSQLFPDQLAQCAVGTLYVHVINPLIVGVGATNNIHIQVFMSSTDIEYFWLRPAQVIAQVPDFSLAAIELRDKERKAQGKPVSSPFSPPPTSKSAFQQQSATGDFAPQLASGQAAMAAPGSVIGTQPASLIQVPKRGHSTNVAPLHNIRMILKRYVKIFSTNNVGNGITQTFNMNDLYVTDTQPYQWLNMYVGVRGNSRFKVYQIGSGAGAQSFYQLWAAVPYTLTTPSTSSSFQCPWDIKTGSDNNHCFEEETSFITQYNYMLNPALSTIGEISGYSNWGSLNTIVTYATGTGNSVLQTVLWAGGDDFRPGLLIGPMYSVVKQYAV
jgi:hypothetical protein